MENALHDFLNRLSSVSALDTFLLVIIFLLARQRYGDLVEDIKCGRERIRRIERVLIANGFELGEIEEE